MSRVVIQGLRLPLGEWALEVDAVITGRVTAIFGRSGAGKTSLLEWIAGLRRAETGRLEIDGTVLVDAAARMFLPPSERRLGYVPQDGALFPHLSVRENLSYGFTRTTERRPGLELSHVVAVLEIGSLLDRRVSELSGGEKQRVALGRALLAQPRLLLLDEPLASLDAALKRRLVPYLARVRDEFGIAMLYVSHDPDEVVALCDDVLLLEQGKIRRRGPPAELFQPAKEQSYELRAGE